MYNKANHLLLHFLSLYYIPHFFMQLGFGHDLSSFGGLQIASRGLRRVDILPSPTLLPSEVISYVWFERYSVCLIWFGTLVHDRYFGYVCKLRQFFFFFLILSICIIASYT